MTRMTKRRGAALGAAAALLSIAGMLFGAGASQAGSNTPCNNETPPGDIYVDTGLVVAGVDPALEFNQVYVCVAGAAVPYNYVVANLGDPNPTATGRTVALDHCRGYGVLCTTLLAATGVEVVAPSVSVNAPLNGAAPGTGGGISTAPGTCVYANGTPTCVAGGAVVSVTVNEADAVPKITGPGPATEPCTGIGSTCLPAVAVTVGNDSAPTVSVTAAGTTRTADLPPCLGPRINAPC